MKFHDNIHGPQYGADHMLTNNWNPEPIYGADEYIRVYFRIDCPAYVFNGGYPSFPDEESRSAFYTEAQGVLAAFGIPEGTGHRSENLPGVEHLHIHPQNISGVVGKNRVKPVAEALGACRTFSVGWVDVYEDVSAMNNEEFLLRLAEKETEIAADLLEAFRTKRSNLYIVPDGWSGPIVRLVEKYHIPRRVCEKPNEDGACQRFIQSVFDDLLSSGEIISAETNHGTGYRTAKKEKKSA